MYLYFQGLRNWILYVPGKKDRFPTVTRNFITCILLLWAWLHAKFVYAWAKITLQRRITVSKNRVCRPIPMNEVWQLVEIKGESAVVCAWEEEHIWGEGAIMQFLTSFTLPSFSFRLFWFFRYLENENVKITGVMYFHAIYLTVS